MPAPAPYVPGQTGTLGDVLEHGPDLQSFTPAGPNGFAPAPSWTQMFQASRPEALRATPGYDDAKIAQGYAPIVDALGLPASENPGYFADLDPQARARFGTMGKPSDLATQTQIGEQLPFSNQRLADRALQESLVIDQLRARRAKDPGFLPGVPDTADGLHQYFEQQQAAKRATGAEVLSRGTTFGRVTAGFAAGGVESALHDPTFLPAMVLGGGAADGVIQAVGRDALINGVLTAANQPVLAQNMAENNEHLTLGEVASNVATGAVVGGAFGGAIHGGRALADLAATHVPPALFEVMPESVQTRWADRMHVGEGKTAPLLKDVLGDMNNRELSSFARSTIGPHMTPDESAAANVLERTQEIGDASPFMPGPAGDGAHNANIASELKAILDGTPARPSSTGAMLSSTSLTPSLAGPVSTANARVPGDIVDFFKSKGLDDAHAYGIAAGIVAESGGREGAVNPKSGALGLGQWLGSRKASLLDRYGPNPSRTDQLEHLWGELTGGDPGGKFVLGAKDAGSVLDAYVRKFMRPHAGFETNRDLAAGMEALGHPGERAPADQAGQPSAGGLGGDDELGAALQRDAEQADAEALDAQRSLAEPGARSAGAEITLAEMPILKRELFPNDGEWAEAQLALMDNLGRRDAPQSPGNGASGGDTGARPPEVAETGEGAQIASDGAPAAPSAAPQYQLLDSHNGHEVVWVGKDFTEGLAKQRAMNADVEDRNGVPRYLLGKVEAERGPLTRAEIDAAHPEYQFVGAKRDALYLAAHDHAFVRESGREPGPLWVARDNRTGEIAHWSVKKKATEELVDRREWEPDQFTIEKMSPEAINAEMRQRIADREAMASASTARIDDPALKSFDDGSSGRAELADSLEHDYRAEAADPELAKRAYQIDDVGKPQTLIDILDDLDRETAAVKALRACAAPGGEA